MAIQPLDDLQIKISVSASDATNSIKKLKDNIEKLKNIDTSGLERLIGQLHRLNDQSVMITHLAAAVGELSRELNRIGGNATNLTTVATAASRVANVAQEVGGAVEDASTEIEDSIEKVAEKTNVLSSLFNGVKDAARSALSMVSKAFDGATAKLGGLVGSIKRIAFYRMIRSAIKAVTKALREGVDMLILWDRTYGNNTSYAAKTADEIASKWREVKKSIGAAAMPIIQIFQPALMWLMNTVITVVNTINQAFRAFQGFSTYIKATDKGFKSATGSAKALKAVLFGFDELNVLPDASGGGASAEVGAIDFEETDITSDLANVGKQILDGIRAIVEDAKEILSGIWEVIRGKFKMVLGLLGGDFELFKEGLKDWVSGWADTIAAVFKTLIGWAQRFFEPLYMWFYNNVWKPIGDFCKEIPNAVKTAFESVKNFFVNIWNSIATWFSGSFIPYMKGLPKALWEDFKADIKAVGEFFKNIWNGISTWFSETFLPYMKGLPKALWEDFKSDMQTVANFFRDSWQSIKGFAEDAWSGIKSTFVVVPNWFKEKFTEAWTAVKNVFSTGGKIFDGIKDGIVNGFKTVVNAIIRGLNRVIAIPFNGINSALSKIRDINILGFEPFKNLIRTINVPQIPTLAKGGFVPNMPNVGSLFMAGENGAELVTHAPNGTEVMNGNQVEQAMQNANVEVINAIYAMANMVVGAVNNKNFDIYMDAQKVGKSVSQYQYNVARQYGG